MSEIKQIKTGVAEIIAVKVPEGAHNFRFENGHLWYDDKNFKGCCIYITGKSIKYEPLGIDTELTVQQCSKLVHPDLRYRFDTAKEAFASLMRANGCYSVNPLGYGPFADRPDDDFFYPHWRYKKEQWQQAEANTGTWLVLKRLS